MNKKLQDALAAAQAEQLANNKADRDSTYFLAELIVALDTLASQVRTELESADTNDHMVVVEGKQDESNAHLKKIADELPVTRQTLANISAQLTDLEDISVKLNGFNVLGAKLDTLATKLDELIAKP